MPTMTASQTVLPPEDLSELKTLQDALPHMSQTLQVGITAILNALASGEAVQIEPVSTVLTTTEAAKILNISRMTMVKLLEDGHIPYQQPSVHRQVLLSDVLAYKEERSRLRTHYFQESMRDAAEMDLLMLDINDYLPALREAKRNSDS
ncbi:MAG: helix-turn-helix domain-containing protein [Propionibacteriaceae bacterium]|nr:helix-turn-helix domain-containing protein [Propionibacteriaceae bacterium]